MQYESRLFTVAKLRRLSEECDDIANACVDANEALMEYEDAEGSEEKEDARDRAWGALNDIVDKAEGLRKLRDSLYEKG